jgi:hypothetical protein
MSELLGKRKYTPLPPQLNIMQTKGLYSKLSLPQINKLLENKFYKDYKDISKSAKGVKTRKVRRRARRARRARSARRH